MRPDTLNIMTETFRNVLPKIEDDIKGAYHVLLDEGIDAFDKVSFSPRDQKPFLEPIEVGADGSITVANGGQEILEEVAFHPGRLAAIQREELKNKSYQKLAKLLVSDTASRRNGAEGC